MFVSIRFCHDGIQKLSTFFCDVNVAKYIFSPKHDGAAKDLPASKKTEWRRERTVCSTAIEFVLDNRQLSVVSYVYTSAQKRKQHDMSLVVFSWGLLGVTCSHFTNAVICAHLLCDSSYSLWRSWRMKFSTALLPSGRTCIFACFC